MVLAFLSLTACTHPQTVRHIVQTPKPLSAPQKAPKTPNPLRPHRQAVGPLRRAVRRSERSIWDCIAEHESGGNWAYNDGNYEGGLNFMHSTWVAAGGRRYAEHAYQATREQQIAIATGWLAQTSWAQWPQTSRICGVR